MDSNNARPQLRTEPDGGSLLRIGRPAFARAGTFESEVLDAASFAYWGRLALRGSHSGIAVRTRSGNLNRPVNNWSAWTAVPLQANGKEWGGRIASPSARFLQYEIGLTGSGAEPPDVSSVEIASGRCSATLQSNPQIPSMLTPCTRARLSSATSRPASEEFRDRAIGAASAQGVRRLRV